MNNKVLAAFIGGLMVASGITYVLMKRPESTQAARAIAPVSAAQPVVDASAPATSADAKTVFEVKEEPAAVAPATKRSPAPARIASRVPPPSKPSPVSPRPAERAAPTEPSRPSPAPSLPVEVAKVQEPPSAAEPAPLPMMPKFDPPAPKPNTVTIPAGTSLMVRLGETLSTERNRPGDTFSATLDQPLIVDGFVIAERGARAQGRVVESDRSGRVKGVALMQVELIQLSTADGQKVRLNTAFIEKKADTSRKSDAAKVGVGAAIGAAIGAIAGGGKGAAVGAGVGGAAGAGDVLLTRGKDVEMRVESRVTFKLSEALTITEKLR